MTCDFRCLSFLFCERVPEEAEVKKFGGDRLYYAAERCE